MALFRKWGPWVLGAAVLIILGVAGYQWYDSQQSEASAEAGSVYMTAMEKRQDGDLEGSRADLESLLNGAPGEYEVLALMQIGAIANEQGNSDEAGRFFEQAADATNDPIVRDAALYQSLLTQLDSLSYDDVVLRAGPLLRGDSALELMAVELLGISAIENERWTEARQHYERLQFSLDAPQNMGQRAVEAMALINQIAPDEQEIEDTPTETTEPEATENETPDETPGNEEEG